MILPNPKHEEFAQNLARGMKQGEAYRRAGYLDNKSAASRLAAEPLIADRVTEIEDELKAKMQTAMTLQPDEIGKGLEGLGLTFEWVAKQYKNVYDLAIEDRSLTAANGALERIQKLIEAEKHGLLTEAPEQQVKISIKDTLALLKGMKEAMLPVQHEMVEDTCEMFLRSI